MYFAWPPVSFYIFELVVNLKNLKISPKYLEFSLFWKNLHPARQVLVGLGATAPSGIIFTMQITGLTHFYSLPGPGEAVSLRLLITEANAIDNCSLSFYCGKAYIT